MGKARKIPDVIALGADFFAGELAGPQRRSTVVHYDGCTRAPCECFGITSDLTETAAEVLVLRLMFEGEVVGTVRLLPIRGRLMLAAAATYRASTTEDWAWHHQVVTETMLREAVRVADERGCELDVSWDEPRALLDELGFRPEGLLLRRPASLPRG